jgi:hypothetical protein
MTQSMISFWVGLVVLVVVASALSRRYGNGHPGESLSQRLGTHPYELDASQALADSAG